MWRSFCVALLALALSPLSYSSVSFSSHAAQCSSGLCTRTSLQHADLNGDGLEDL